jgi:hypothetical protein
MSKINFDLKNVQFSINDKKGFDQSYITRYILITELVKQASVKLGKTNLNILDLGGYNGLARELLPDHNVTILDIFEDDKLQNYIKVDTVGIPTENNTFDIVISTDVLEHIAPADRILFLSEAQRVSKEFVFIAAPFVEDGVAAEEHFANMVYFGETKQEYSWLKEHHEYGLPDSRLVMDVAHKYDLKVLSFSHTSVRLWGELISSAHFISDNISAIDKSMGNRLKKLNKFYFKELANQDFPKIGYRKFFILSKNSEIAVSLPEYDEERIIDFIGRIKEELGITVATLTNKYANVLSRNEELNNRLVELEKIKLEIPRLEQIEASYNALLKSKRLKITAPLVKVSNKLRNR